MNWSAEFAVQAPWGQSGRAAPLRSVWLRHLQSCTGAASSGGPLSRTAPGCSAIAPVRGPPGLGSAFLLFFSFLSRSRRASPLLAEQEKIKNETEANKEAALLIADDSSPSVIPRAAEGRACTSSTPTPRCPANLSFSFFIYLFFSPPHHLHPPLPPALASSRLLSTSQVPDLPVQPLQPPTCALLSGLANSSECPPTSSLLPPIHSKRL